MSRPRRPSSRPAGGRPRKIAGRRDETTEDPAAEVRGSDGEDEDPAVEVRGAPAPSLETPEDERGGGFEARSARTSTTGGDHRPRRRRLTWVLVAMVAVLALVLVVEAALLVFYRVVEDEPAVSAQRPVVTGELSHRAAVEAAARATEEILSTTYSDYDTQVDQASAKMTDTFAEEYRDTAEGIRDEFIEKRTKLQVKAVAQGVSQASADQVQALLFLNQYVEKVEDGEPTTAFAQYRALVTVVRTDHGWLVSDIETK